MAKRAVQGLDPRPTDAELLRMAEQRNAIRLSGHAKVIVAEQAKGRKAAFVEWAEAKLLREAKRTCPALCHYKLDGSVGLFLAGAPRTKKNHGKVVVRTVRGKKRKFHVPSDAYVSWCASIVAQVANRVKLAARPYNCAAVFYRDADRGDAVGYYQGLADALQAAGVVSDDKLITQWDGSRLRVDRKNPRVELTLTPVEE